MFFAGNLVFPFEDNRHVILILELVESAFADRVLPKRLSVLGLVMVVASWIE